MFRSLFTQAIWPGMRSNKIHWPMLTRPFLIIRYPHRPSAMGILLTHPWPLLVSGEIPLRSLWIWMKRYSDSIRLPISKVNMILIRNRPLRVTVLVWSFRIVQDFWSWMVIPLSIAHSGISRSSCWMVWVMMENYGSILLPMTDLVRTWINR